MLARASVSSSQLRAQHEADVEMTRSLCPRWGWAVMTVNYCPAQNVTLEAVTKQSLKNRAVSPGRRKHRPAWCTKTNCQSSGYKYWLFILREFKMLCLHLQFSTAFCSPSPRAWWRVFAVFAFSLNGKHKCINKCLCMIQALSLIGLWFKQNLTGQNTGPQISPKLCVCVCECHQTAVTYY